MKLVIFFVIISISPLYAQNIIQGRILSENNFPIGDVMIINIQSKTITSTDKEGNFKIEAKTNDELRFIKENYERGSKVIKNSDFLTLLSIQLVRVPIEIKEVRLATKLTGDLKKDIEISSYSKKVVSLNEDIEEYIKTHPEEGEKKEKKVTNSMFDLPDIYQGQINLLGVGTGGGGGVLGVIIEKFVKKHNRTLSLSEINGFHKRIKENINEFYFLKQGLDEYELQSYIIYADEKLKLAKRYYNNFNKKDIENQLKNLLPEYLNEKIQPIRKK